MYVLGLQKGCWFSARLHFGSVRFFSSFKRRLSPHRDSYYYTRLLQHCTNTKSIKEIHAQIITSGYEQNQFLAANLVSQYVEHSGSSMDDAKRVFDCVQERDIFLWNVLIRGYASLGPFAEAMNIYAHMRFTGVFANKYTYPFLLKACAAMGVKVESQLIHGHVVKVGLEFDLFVGNSLVAFYAKCHEIEISRKVFDGMPVKDIVSWNSIIAGYSQNACPSEALMIFHQMLRDCTSFVPDHATFVGVLPACAQEASIREGMWIHCFIIKSGMEVDAILCTGLISLYGNCGRLDTARELFLRLHEKNIFVWNAMIRCYGMHGHTKDALELFSQMVDSGIQPDGICFICVLSACSHAGLVDKGWELFGKMGAYGVERWEEHYACMVDLLGRAGQLDEAVKLIQSMSTTAGKHVYGALLGACRMHNNIDLAEEVAKKLFVLDPNNAGRYIILAKMYEDIGRFTDAAKVRKTIRNKQIKKQFGSSAIELESVRNTFGAEDESHPRKGQIFDTLEQLDGVIEENLIE